jgi:hypothetical protein
MEKLSKVMANPSGWDSMANYAGDVPADEWLCLITRNRDSDCLSESNWACALAELGGEGENVQIFRFGHWACGWWEALAVKADTPQEAIAQAMADRLADYPVLDEYDFSEREQEEADTVWRDCYNDKGRIDYIRKFRSQFEFHNYADLIGCVRGRYFAGYASELIN